MNYLRIARALAGPALLGVVFALTPVMPAYPADGDGTWRDFVPPARRGASAAFDVSRDRMILFGGSEQQTLSNETWSFGAADSVWTRLATVGGPPPARTGAAMLYDSSRDRMWMFGGYLSGGFLSGLLALDLEDPGTWRLVTSGTGPAARGAGSLVLDTSRDRLLLFGGQISSVTTTGATGDVWAFTPDTGTPSWERIIPTGAAPTARWGAIVVYDAERDRMIVLGGRDRNTVYNDAWELSFSPSPMWTQLTTFGPHPPARDGALGVLDAAGGRIVTAGGVDPVTGASLTGVWAFRLTGLPDWDQLPVSGVSPLDLGTACAAFDPVRRRMLVHGGGRPTAAVPTYVSHQTWALDLAGAPAWSRLAPAHAEPTPRFGQATAFDPSAGGGLWLFGGRTAREGADMDSGELWRATLDRPAWEGVTPSGVGPEARVGAAGMFDPETRRLFVFGGARTETGQYFNDTWIVKADPPRTWSRLPGPEVDAPAPTARSGHASIYDPLRRSWIVFGGENEESTFGDVWELPFAAGSAWRPVATAGDGPSPRSAARAIYDAPRDRMIVFGGTASGRSLGDVWALSLGATPRWTQLVPANKGPGPRSECGAFYDDVRQRLVVWGGYEITDDVIFSSSGVWALPLADAPTWSMVGEIGVRPYPASSASVVYDAARDRMVTFGGTQTFGEYLADFRALEFGGVSARRVWLIGAQAAADGVHLLWQTDALVPTSVRVERRIEVAPDGSEFSVHGEQPGDWLPLGDALTGVNGLLAWTDPDVGPGGVYHYRLQYEGEITGETVVMIPGAPQLAVTQVAPMPTAGMVTLAMRSTGKGPIELTLYDVRGRRVARQDFGTLPEGSQSVSYEIPQARSGVYFLHLKQGTSEVTRKVVVAR